MPAIDSREVTAHARRAFVERFEREVDPDALVFTTTERTPLRRTGFRRSWWLPAVRAAGCRSSFMK